MKKKLMGFIVTLVLAVTLAFPMMMSAMAADPFKADAEGNAVYPGGDSQKVVLDALDAKIAELNVKIKKINDDKGSLDTEYKKGNIIAYSRENDGIINMSNKRSGWKVWEGAAVMDLKKINKGYDDWGDNSVGWLSYNGVTKKANLITAEFANKFGRDGNQKLGSAVSDMFRTTGENTTYTAYQNFNNGYMKSENGNVSVVWKKNVKLNTEGNAVTEVVSDPTATGYVGAASTTVLTKAGIDSTAFAAKFVTAYNDFKAKGFNVGEPFSSVADPGKNSGGSDGYGTISAQNFRNGDSVSDPWNDSNRRNWSFLAYNFDEGKVFLIRDEFHFAYENRSKDPSGLGDPVGNDFVFDGNRYQNFQKGYMKATGATPSNKTVAEVVSGKNIAADGTVSAIQTADRIGLLGASATLPAGYTEQSFKAAFKAAYDSKLNLGENLTGVDLVESDYGVLLQKYTGTDGKIHTIMFQAKESGTGDFYYLLPEVFTCYTKNSGLGKQTAERMQVAEGAAGDIFAYPFANGYIKLTVSEQEDFNDEGEVITVINYSAIATVGAVYDADKKFFATTSYAANITEAIVNASVANAYDELEIPDNATLAAKFKAAYESAFAKGFSAGEPASEGITWWTTGQSGVVKLTLKGGNGNANFWGDNTLMTYNPTDKNVYITTGDIANTYANLGASGNGWPMSEMMYNTKTGVIVQNYDIWDPVVTEGRPIHIITSGGRTEKVTGSYDLEANKEGGEWVEYITRFGGSISSKPLNVEESYTAGEAISINFANYITNANGFYVSYNKSSGEGAVSNAGVYTFTPAAAGKFNVTVEVFSAFDKLTFSVEFNVKAAEGGGEQPGGGDEPGGEVPSVKGCGSILGSNSGANTIIFGGVATLIIFGAFVFIIKAKRKND